MNSSIPKSTGLPELWKGRKRGKHPELNDSVTREPEDTQNRECLKEESQRIGNTNAIYCLQQQQKGEKKEEGHLLPLLLAEELPDENEEDDDDASVRSESPPPPPTPQNPTPPRMRRGSWTFNKSRDRHKKSVTSPMTSSIPKQRARSNSVPAVLSLAQLPLFRHTWIPEIVVSGDRTEAEVADVVEGFSWTLAESIIEDILKEMEASTRRPFHTLPLPPDIGSRKGILKNASNDSLYRSYSGSLEEPSGSQSGNGSHSGNEGCSGINQTPIPVASPSQGLSWSHRSTSMPSLSAIDQDFRNSGEYPQVSLCFTPPISSGSSGHIMPFSSGFISIHRSSSILRRFSSSSSSSSSFSSSAIAYIHFLFVAGSLPAVGTKPLPDFRVLSLCSFNFLF